MRECPKCGKKIDKLTVMTSNISHTIMKLDNDKVKETHSEKPSYHTFVRCSACTQTLFYNKVAAFRWLKTGFYIEPRI